MITCCKHYQSCDIIKEHYSEEIEVAVIEYMPVPFDENINAKDYILSNIHNLNLLIQNVFEHMCLLCNNDPLKY